MAGTVYLRTNCFEVKLEGITFKTRDFETLCMMDFLFPEGKIWASPPVVGLNAMPHPRDPFIILLLLCFGVGCVILRLRLGEPLPATIHRFLTDERIRFVGFGIPEKKDLFPFEELGLTKRKVDVGYLAAKILKDQKYKRWDLAELARKVLGIKRMIGLTDASSFERHEQVKCAICQLFITTIVAMGLLGSKDKKELDDSPKKTSFLKNLSSLPSLTEGWFKLPKIKKENRKSQVADEVDGIPLKTKHIESPFGIHAFLEDVSDEDSFGKGLDFKECSKVTLWDCLAYAREQEGTSSEDSCKDDVCTSKKPLKGILKSPSSGFLNSNSCPSTPRHQMPAGDQLKRANSKGHNVSFKCH